MIHPKPGRALPVRDDGLGRPVQVALTVRRAANPRVRDPSPYGRRPAPVAAGLGAQWAGLSEREAEAVFAAGAHLALLPLTRCGRWTFSRTTPSTESLGVGLTRAATLRRRKLLNYALFCPPPLSKI